MPQPQIFTQQQIISLRKSGGILRAALDYVHSLTKPGITTGELDRAAETFIRDHGGKPAFKGYRGFPATFCISINDECVHGIPGKRVIEDGDIVSLDGGVVVDGMFTDACITVPAGSVSVDALRLIAASKEALDAGIAAIHAGCRVGDISAAVQKVVESRDYAVIAPLTGHGVGAAVHQYPDIPNVGKAGTGPVLPAGACIAVEPIIAMGSGEIRELDDGWTLASADGSLTAHSEHTVVVTEEGSEIIA